jgi:hypothetical protein
MPRSVAPTYWAVVPSGVMLEGCVGGIISCPPEPMVAAALVPMRVVMTKVPLLARATGW